LHGRFTSSANRLLGSALHPFCSWRDIVVIVLTHASGSLCSGVASCVDVFEIVVFGHAVAWWSTLLHPRWQYLFQQLEISQFRLVGELDFKLDVQIAEIVVSERWHSLAFDDLDRT
jgi:hypothetical protein